MPKIGQERRFHGRVFVRLYRKAIADNDRIGYLTRLHDELERLGVPERLTDAAYEFGLKRRALLRRYNAPAATDFVN